MDILTLNALQSGAMTSDRFNEFFPERPVWCYHAVNDATNNFMVDFFAPNSLRPMRTFRQAQSGANVPPLINTIANTEFWAPNYTFNGHASTQPSSNALNPASGYNGLASHLNGACFANIDYNDEGPLSAYYSDQGHFSQYHGVVLGEPGYRQGTERNYVQGLEVGVADGVIWTTFSGNTVGTLSNSSETFAWNTLTGIQLLAGGVAANSGMICYNRVNNTLALVQAGGSAGTYRLHAFKNLPEKIRPNDAAHLKAMLEGAIAGSNGSSYETFDFSWNTADTNTEGRYHLCVVYCDDHTVWLGSKYISNAFHLGRIYYNSSVRVFQALTSQSLTTSYGIEQGAYYGVHHMMSDDNSAVAIFTNYYYYLCGFVGFFVDRASAQISTKYAKYALNDTSYGFSIAPFGGKSFILDSNVNSDGRKTAGYLLNITDAKLTGATLTSFSYAAFISGNTGGTSYGGSMVCKVKPSMFRTTEYKEIYP